MTARARGSACACSSAARGASPATAGSRMKGHATPRFGPAASPRRRRAATRDGVFQTRSYPSAHVGSSAQGGWEYVEWLRLEKEAPRVAEQAEALLTADVCPSMVTTVVLD